MSELLMIRRPWMSEARCLDPDADPDWWHPEGFYARRTMAFAKSLCRECPVRTTCLRENLHEPDGVWGATDPLERKRLRDRMGAA